METAFIFHCCCSKVRERFYDVFFLQISAMTSNQARFAIKLNIMLEGRNGTLCKVYNNIELMDSIAKKKNRLIWPDENHCFFCLFVFRWPFFIVVIVEILVIFVSFFLTTDGRHIEIDLVCFVRRIYERFFSLTLIFRTHRRNVKIKAKKCTNSIKIEFSFHKAFL